MIWLRRDTTRRVFLSSLGGWPSFVDGLHRSTETVARKRASATKRTPTTVTSYTTDFISLCYVPRRDVGCRKPTISLYFSLFLYLFALSPPSSLTSHTSLSFLLATCTIILYIPVRTHNLIQLFNKFYFNFA